MVLGWVLLIHVTAVVGLLLYPVPGWRLFLASLGLAWIGGLGTTVCYHRALAHRSLELKAWARVPLVFFAIFNGSGTPLTWAAGHRAHHAYADSEDDISSPVWGGFWWAHLRWLWQAEDPSPERFCPDLNRREFWMWRRLLTPILALSYFGGLYWGLCAFFWLGAIRLVFALHAQCFVNSVCHSQPGVGPDEDSSRNVAWLAVMHLFQGENWHRNHHARPGIAQLGWSWHQPDVGYLVILLLERLGLASEVRRLRR